MKKLAPLLAVLLILTGCFGSNQNEVQTAPEKTPIELKSSEEVEQQLSSDGWVVQNTTAANFHLWEKYEPTTLLLAENKKDQVLLYGIFPDEQKAIDAFESVVPLSDDAVQIQDSDWYQQALVTLPENQGNWLFRQAGSYVLGGWFSNPEDFSHMANLFESLQISPAPNLTPEPKEAIVGDQPLQSNQAQNK